jgi:hypothetical protein
MDGEPPAHSNIPEFFPSASNLRWMSQEQRAPGEVEPQWSYDPYEERKKELKLKAENVKKRLEDNQKLRLSFNQNSPLRKAGFSLVISVIALVVSVVAKAKKKTAAGAFISTFILAYLTQFLATK